MGIYYNMKKSFIRNLVEFSLTQFPDGIGTAFPGSPVSKQTFYRTDQGKLYKYDTSWKEIDIDYFFFDLDAHADEQQLPINSTLAIKSFSAQVDEHIITMDCLVGVMIANDTNLKKHDRVIDALFTMLFPTKYLKIWDMTTGTEIGSVQATNGAEVMPMYKANQRPLQFVAVSMICNLTANLVSP